MIYILLNLIYTTINKIKFVFEINYATHLSNKCGRTTNNYETLLITPMRSIDNDRLFTSPF